MGAGKGFTEQKNIEQEIYRHQQAQKKWTLLGGKNTNYFQTITTIKKWHNYIW